MRHATNPTTTASRPQDTTCRRDGAELRHDINGVPYCPTCRHAARFVGVPDATRRQAHAAAYALAHTQTSEAES